MTCSAVAEAKQKSFKKPTSIGGVLQRKCATCGQHSIAGAQCVSCNKGLLQRQASNRHSASEAPPIVHDVLSSPGRPLDAGTRATFEPRFGHDFSRVRVHTDSRAAESARAVNALAYTVGNNVVFGAGQHRPGTAFGNAVLAHELTHVVQQSHSPGVPSSLKIGPENDHHEAEAHRNTSSPIASVNTAVQQVGVVQRAGPLAVAGAVAGAAAAGFAIGFGGAFAVDYLSMTKARAERFANELDTTYAGWLDEIPSCPCTTPSADTEHWVRDNNPNLQDAHPGASYSYRSKQTYNRHGQQCTYDADNNLITGGAAAGTPDFYGPADLINIPYHAVYDYKTFKELGWARYTKTWRPDNRQGCKTNVI